MKKGLKLLPKLIGPFNTYRQYRQYRHLDNIDNRKYATLWLSYEPQQGMWSKLLYIIMCNYTTISHSLEQSLYMYTCHRSMHSFVLKLRHTVLLRLQFVNSRSYTSLRSQCQPANCQEVFVSTTSIERDTCIAEMTLIN